MPSRTAQLVREATERTPLLKREDTVDFATHVPEDAPVVEHDKHYNLAGLSPGNFWVLCISMWSCAFLSAFDGTIVATLLGPISSSFNASNLASWLGTSYLLSVCCFTPIYGRLCDIIGRQPSMLIALSFFSIGNIGCAFAPTMEFLIFARAIAGIGGGGLTSVGSTIMSDLVPITHRGIFQGYGNILFGLGSGLGAPIGGIVNDTLNWRWAFIGQIPLLLGAMCMIWFKVRYTIQSPSSSGSSTPVAQQTAWQKLGRIDWLGSFLLAGGIGSILLAVSLVTSSTGAVVEGLQSQSFHARSGHELDAWSWSDPIILGLFGGGAIVLVIFLYVEIYIAAEPVLPVELLTQRTPIFVAINNLAISVLSFGTLYTVPLYYTAVRLMTASNAGLHLIPNSFLGSIGSLSTGFIVRATGRYYWLTAFCGFWSIVAAVLLSTWDLNTSEFLMWTSYGPMAFAIGSVTTLTIVALIADIGREHVAVATSLSYMFRTTGQVLGASLSGALTQAVLQTELSKRITGPGAAETIAHIRQSSDSIRYLPPDLQLIATASYQKALHAVFIGAIVFAVIGVLSGLGMREVSMTVRGKRPQVDDEEA